MPDQIAAEDRQAPQVIAETLIGEIRSGVIATDSPLPTERSLCTRFDTSRPTVREALALMQMRGYLSGGGGRRPRATLPSLLEVLRGAGGMIREVLGDDESGAHIEQMRNFIEIGAVREAATRADPLQATKMLAALQANRDAIGKPGFAATDIAFHRAIVAGTSNPVMLALHDMFLSEMLAARPPETDRGAHDRVVYDEHRRIYDAVLASDPAAATEVMEKHLYRSWRSRLASPKPADTPD